MSDQSKKFLEDIKSRRNERQKKITVEIVSVAGLVGFLLIRMIFSGKRECGIAHPKDCSRLAGENELQTGNTVKLFA